MGLSNYHVRNLHFISALETNSMTTCAAEQSLAGCLVLNRMLLK